MNWKIVFLVIMLVVTPIPTVFYISEIGLGVLRHVFFWASLFSIILLVFSFYLVLPGRKKDVRPVEQHGSSGSPKIRVLHP